MDDDDAQFLVVELAAGVNCQDLSETLGTPPFEHPNSQWLVLGSTPARVDLQGATPAGAPRWTCASCAGASWYAPRQGRT